MSRKLPYFVFLLESAVLLFAAALGWTLLETPAGGSHQKIRKLEFREKITLEAPSGARRLQLWIPMPANDPYQKAELVKVEAPWKHRVTKDQDFGNDVLYFEASKITQGTQEISLQYRIERQEQRGFGQNTDQGRPPELYTKPRGLVVVNDTVKKIAAEITAETENSLDKARAIYHYVLSHVDYDTKGNGWGNGDVVYACEVGKGNCTDFHSLFMALSLANNIPARFRIGHPLPKEPEATLTKAYHCWAEFYLEGKGWIPVDISEAWKRPSRAEYFFGNLDPDRLVVTTGRYIRLSPQQQGAPLNYFIKPYAEVDGKQLEAIKISRSYKNLE